MKATVVSAMLTLGAVPHTFTSVADAAGTCVPAAVDPAQFVVGGQFNLAAYSAAVAAANLACSSSPLPATGTDTTTTLQIAFGLTAVGAAAVGTAAVRRRRSATA